MTEITKDTLIGDILDADRGTAKYFLEMGMHCLGANAIPEILVQLPDNAGVLIQKPMGESIEQACMVHGVDVNSLVDEINDYLASK